MRILLNSFVHVIYHYTIYCVGRCVCVFLFVCGVVIVYMANILNKLN